jgi:hypothetical protein
VLQVGIGNIDEFQDGKNISHVGRGKRNLRLPVLVQGEEGCRHMGKGMVVQSLQTKKMLLHLQETLCCDGQSLYG